MPVKYTDVDYFVFTDASRHVAQGGSPYDRHTYRYTPLLAWLLLPNITLTPVFGKMLFSVFDLIAGYMIYRLTNGSGRLASLWLLSPITLNVSSRGSCDSIICVMVLGVLFLAEFGHWKRAAALFGLSVHFRLFPIVFGLPLLIKMGKLKRIMQFGFVSSFVFFSLLGLFYFFYGWDFVYETYLYHFVRKDHRHNFSLFFYPIYLITANTEKFSSLVGLVTFLPQIAALGIVGLMRRPLCVIVLLQTLIFVAFNKVITAQYFTWFLCLLPLCVPHIQKGSGIYLLSLLTFWLATELHWLYHGFLLEIQGHSQFLGVFWASLLFFIAHICLIVFIIVATKNYAKNRKE